MAQKHKLLPVQVENLKKQYIDNFKKQQNLINIKNEESADKKMAAGLEINFGDDVSLLGSLSIAAKNYKEAEKILANYEIIESRNADVIGLGSTFEVNMDAFGIETFTLVEIKNSYDDRSFVSIDSPLGKAVNGAKVGDKISYKVDQNLFTGTITDIVKEKEKTGKTL